MEVLGSTVSLTVRTTEGRVAGAVPPTTTVEPPRVTTWTAVEAAAVLEMTDGTITTELEAVCSTWNVDWTVAMDVLAT